MDAGRVISLGLSFAYVDSVMGQFHKTFAQDAEAYEVWVKDVYDSYIIAAENNVLYKVNYMALTDGIVFAPRDQWVKVDMEYIDRAAKHLASFKQFDDTEWSGAASQWDTADAYCADCLIDANPAGQDKTKALCYLPYRKPGANEPNRAALRAIAGGRGIGRLEKPADVSADTWSAKLRAAANKLIGWWPDAFEQPAPDAIYEIAGKTPPSDGRSWQDKVKSAVQTIVDFCTWSEGGAVPDNALHAKSNVAQPIACPDLSAPCGVAVKDVDGEPWHFTWSTNAFEDREGEIFSTKALESYVAESWTREDKGTFDFWHIPGSDFARKEWQGIVGRFLVEAGPYMDNEAGQRAKAFFKQYPVSHPEIAPEGWGASPEFRFLPEDRADGVYDWLWITKTSTLPKAAAANIHTQGKLIMLSEDQREAAVKIFGESFVAGLEEQGKQKTEELEAAGVAHKSGGEAKPDEAADEQPAEETAPVEAETASEEEAPAEDDGPQVVDVDAEALAEAVAKQFSVNLDPITEVIKEIGDKVAGLEARLVKMEKTEAVKQATETPRVLFNLIRASQAVETEIDEKDKLNDQKPKEAALPQGSTVSAFFNNQ